MHFYNGFTGRNKMLPRKSYFFAVPVTEPRVLARIQKYTDLIHILFGIDPTRKRERPIITFPPFYANNEMLYRMNLHNDLGQRMPHHPIKKVIYSLDGMVISRIGDVDVIHFPILVHTNGQVKSQYVQYLYDFHTHMRIIGVTPKEPVQQDYVHHIRVLLQGGLRNSPKMSDVAKIINQSRAELPIIFKGGFPKLYTQEEENTWVRYAEGQIRAGLPPY